MRITPAKAKKLRKVAMESCGCHLCHFALNPAMTFADHSLRMASSEDFNMRTHREAA